MIREHRRRECRPPTPLGLFPDSYSIVPHGRDPVHGRRPSSASPEKNYRPPDVFPAPAAHDGVTSTTVHPASDLTARPATARQNSSPPRVTPTPGARSGGG